ncbi:hypothetical protein [Arsukibacterium indicum]|uniref:Lipoprotein n=1 Tax=Arsukibacterium indicum TaxID=2848612 RepID=A0ABS6ML37_9GAMM|nr:hypothetical protein [Arsukibacterium indicum]MBV2129300.1 hypothetical protein [Arsukibacterium indicum]
MKTALIICLLLGITGCSNKGVYQDLQRNKRNECLQLPQAEYDKCMQTMEMSYEEYERQRQQALKPLPTKKEGH